MEDNGQIVKIAIFGQDYPIRASVEDAEYIRDIAQFVDSKMREIDDTMKPSSTLKIAILTALNIADELMSLKRERDTIDSTYFKKVEAAKTILNKALSID